MPESLLYSVPWFARALQEDGFREGTERSITMPEDEPRAFEVFVYHLCHHEVKFQELTKDCETEKAADLELCFAVWVFGEKYDIPQLQNAIMLYACSVLMISDIHVVKLSPTMLAAYYGATPSDTPLRKLIAEYIIHYICEEDGNIEAYEVVASHSGFLKDLFAARDFQAQSQCREFPRFYQPIKNKEMFFVERAMEQYKDTSSFNGFGDWNINPSIPCEDCKLWQVDQVCSRCHDDQNGWLCRHAHKHQKCRDCITRQADA
jgi:hypothetical protein